MAANGGDARSKRAQARGERRARSSTREQGRQQEHEEPRAEESGGDGRTSLTTPRLVAAGAAAGALLGTAKAVLDRRQGHGAGDEAPESDEEYDEQRAKTHGQRSEHPAGVRGLLVSVLEAALEAVNEPGQTRRAREGGDEEHAREEEDDDEEAEREPRDEHTDDGRPTARGDSGEAGRTAPESTGDQGEDPHTPGGGPGADQEPDEPVTPRAESYDRDDHDYEDDEEPEGRVGERDLGDDAEPIVAARNGDRDAAEVLARAREQIALLVGREPESVSRVEHVDGGWRMAFEVVEMPRIPPTTDVMASYSAALDESGNVIEYGRTQRYYRNRAEGEG